MLLGDLGFIVLGAPGCFWLLLTLHNCWLVLVAHDCAWLLLALVAGPHAPKKSEHRSGVFGFGEFACLPQLLLTSIVCVWVLPVLLAHPDCSWAFLTALGCFWLLLATPGLPPLRLPNQRQYCGPCVCPPVWCRKLIPRLTPENDRIKKKGM